MFRSAAGSAFSLHRKLSFEPLLAWFGGVRRLVEGSGVWRLVGEVLWFCVLASGLLAGAGGCRGHFVAVVKGRFFRSVSLGL